MRTLLPIWIVVLICGPSEGSILSAHLQACALNFQQTLIGHGLSLVERALTPELNLLTVEHGINAMAQEYPSVRALSAALRFPVEGKPPPADSPELKGALQTWLNGAHPGWKVVDQKDMIGDTPLTRDFRKATNRPARDSGNNFIGFDMHNWNLSNRTWSLADPHDITHMASFEVPGFPEAMQKKGTFYVKWMPASDGASAKIDYSPVVHLATTQLIRHLNHTIRNGAWENFSFVLKKGEKPHLTIQGNFSYLIMHGIKEQAESSELAELFLGHYAPLGGNIDLTKLPQIDLYLQQQPDLYRRLKNNMQAGGLLEPNYSMLETKLIQVIDEARKNEPEHLDEKVNRIFDAVAAASVKDPGLADLFHPRRRVQLIEDSVNFYEDYLTWLAKRNPAP